VTGDTQVSPAGFSYTPGNDLSEGTHQVTVDVKDLAGNSAGQLAFSFTVDIIPPVVSGFAPAPDSALSSQTPFITANFSDALSGVDPASVIVTLDGVDVISSAIITDAEFQLTPNTPLQEGEHIVTVDVSDRVGNRAPLAIVSFTIDVTEPAITQFSPQEGVIVGALPTISFEYADSLSGIDTTAVKLSLDGVDITNLATVGGTEVSFIPASVADGVHSVQLDVKDTAANTATKSKK
jgi:hypothetical protein